MRFWILGLFAAFTLFSCGEGTVIAPSDPPEAYYPIEVGKYWVYQVDSIIYDDLGDKICPTSGYIREELKSVLSQDDLSTVYVLEKSYRKLPTDTWQITDIWTLTQGRNFIQRSEENLRFVKMQTPLRVGNTWEGNQFDSELILTVKDEAIAIYKNWAYEVLEVGLAEEIAGVSYEDLMVIQQADDENLIERRYSVEKYAKDVGLVFREMEIFDTQCDGNLSNCEGLTWLEKAERGYAVTQTLIEHN